MSFNLSNEEYEKIHVLESDVVPKPPVSIDDLERMCAKNEILEEVLKDMIDQCIKYTITVAEFIEMEEKVKKGEAEQQEFLDKGESRGRIHDATEDSIKIFSRTLAKQGKDNTWMSDIVSNRASCAKFALTLTLSRINH